MGLVALVALASVAAAAFAVGPETNKKRKPDQDAGHFLGHPTPTYSWHGCTKTSTFQTPVTRPAGLPPHVKGTNQGKVEWSTTSSPTATASGGVVVKWEVDKKWKICGVQVAVRGSHKDLSTDLAMMAGYTSGGKKGNTVKSGREKIKVSISKKEASMGGLESKFGGKKYKIENIYSIAVFIKKK